MLSPSLSLSPAAAPSAPASSPSHLTLPPVKTHSPAMSSPLKAQPHAILNHDVSAPGVGATGYTPTVSPVPSSWDGIDTPVPVVMIPSPLRARGLLSRLSATNAPAVPLRSPSQAGHAEALRVSIPSPAGSGPSVGWGRKHHRENWRGLTPLSFAAARSPVPSGVSWSSSGVEGVPTPSGQGSSEGEGELWGGSSWEGVELVRSSRVSDDGLSHASLLPAMQFTPRVALGLAGSTPIGQPAAWRHYPRRSAPTSPMAALGTRYAPSLHKASSWEEGEEEGQGSPSPSPAHKHGKAKLRRSPSPSLSRSPSPSIRPRARTVSTIGVDSIQLDCGDSASITTLGPQASASAASLPSHDPAIQERDQALRLLVGLSSSSQRSPLKALRMALEKRAAQPPPADERTLRVCVLRVCVCGCVFALVW